MGRSCVRLWNKKDNVTSKLCASPLPISYNLGRATWAIVANISRNFATLSGPQCTVIQHRPHGDLFIVTIELQMSRETVTYKVLAGWSRYLWHTKYLLEEHDTYKCIGNHTYWGIKITEACNPKMVFKICEGISCSSFYVNELDVIVKFRWLSWFSDLNRWQKINHDNDICDMDLHVSQWIHSMMTLVWYNQWHKQTVTVVLLTHLPLDKMVAIWQTIFSGAFSWMKNLVF